MSNNEQQKPVNSRSDIADDVLAASQLEGKVGETNTASPEYAKKVLQRYVGTEKVDELYDEDEQFANALRNLAGPDFEYPEFSYLTVAQAIKKAERMGRELLNTVIPYYRPGAIKDSNAERGWNEAVSMRINGWGLIEKEKHRVVLLKGRDLVFFAQPNANFDNPVPLQDVVLTAALETAKQWAAENDILPFSMVNGQVESTPHILTSKILADRYPAKGSMPQSVVHQLYQLRETEVATLSKQDEITAAQLSDLDRGARTAVASLLFAKCDQAARHALLHDEHHFVRSAARLSQDEIGTTSSRSATSINF